MCLDYRFRRKLRTAAASALILNTQSTRVHLSVQTSLFILIVSLESSLEKAEEENENLKSKLSQIKEICR